MKSGQIGFAAFGSEKKDPDRKVIAEIFKAMFDAGRGEKDVLGGKRLSLTAGNKLSAALRHDVYLIARVWLLEIDAPRLGQLDYEGTMFKHHDIMFAQGTGQTTKCLSEINFQACAGTHGDDVNNTLQCEP